MNKLSLWELDDNEPVLFLIIGTPTQNKCLLNMIGFPLAKGYEIQSWVWKKWEIRKVYE